jgi:hypothetical protein
LGNRAAGGVVDALQALQVVDEIGATEFVTLLEATGKRAGIQPPRNGRSPGRTRARSRLRRSSPSSRRQRPARLPRRAAGEWTGTYAPGGKATVAYGVPGSDGKQWAVLDDSAREPRSAIQKQGATGS